MKLQPSKNRPIRTILGSGEMESSGQHEQQWGLTRTASSIFVHSPVGNLCGFQLHLHRIAQLLSTLGSWSLRYGLSIDAMTKRSKVTGSQ
jgi:hypothetical protein